jgi:PAS domain S-box-containing protein
MDDWEAAGPDLWEQAPCGLLIAAADGAVLRVNATLCRWLGYELAELVGVKRFPALMPMGARVFLQTHWTPLLQIQGSVSEVQLDLLHKDGHRVPMMLSAIRRERDGRLQDEIAVLVAADRKLYERELLAARAKAEAAAIDLELAQFKLRQANEALSAEHLRKDEFLATLAHELRNPLAPLSNVVETIKLRGGAAQLSERELQVLSRQVAQMARLVDDLMNVSRISLGRIDLRLESADLVQLLKFVAEEAAAAVQTAGLSLTTELPAAPLWASVDRARLTQIVANLLNNSVKYSLPGARIGLRATARDGEAVIEVSDTGIGIPPDQLTKIFSMFSQLTPALERSQGGLGIGLALVKGLVGLHGGTVEAYSEGAGKGSRFTVRLPLIAPPAHQAVPATAPVVRADDAVAVVIVDDNVDAAETLGAVMELLGYRISVAHSALDAFRTMAASPPRAAVLDIGLPDMNGYELAKKIRSAPWGADMVLVAATGWGQESDKQAARDAGFDLHFTKPLDFIDLDRQLRAVLPLNLILP